MKKTEKNLDHFLKDLKKTIALKNIQLREVTNFQKPNCYVIIFDFQTKITTLEMA